jgi:cell division protein FtsX
MLEALVVIVIAMFIVLIGTVLFFIRKVRKMLNLTVQAYTDKILLQDQLRQQLEKEEFNDKNTEFVRFLSDSREMAFTYIEDVQAAIKELKAAMDMSDEDQIGNAYHKLLTFLPGETPDMVK